MSLSYSTSDKKQKHQKREKIEKALLNGEKRITDIPAEQRIQGYEFYILACRYARAVSEERYMEVILTMQNDIEICEKEQGLFLRQLSSNLKDSMKYNQFGMIQEKAEGACEL